MGWVTMSGDQVIAYPGMLRNDVVGSEHAVMALCCPGGIIVFDFL